MGGDILKKFKINKNKISAAIKIFSLCTCITSICMLFTLGIANKFFDSETTVKEASVFNNTPFTSVSSMNSDTAVISDNQDNKTYVMPLGTPFGIKLFTDGVIVVSLSDIDSNGSNVCPAKDAGINVGDYIISANGEEITTNSSLAKLISAFDGNPIKLKVKRNNEIFETEISPVASSGSFLAGMWVRDSAAGIGTLTFYNPETGMFGGLGHGITDIDTYGLMDMKYGEPADVTLCGIIKGIADVPGQLQGFFTSDEPIGQLVENNETGIYGTFNNAPEGELMEVADRNEVVKGDAQILVTLDSEGPKLYNICIEEINSLNDKIRNLTIKVTDKKLLDLTGGIVQGMSGSPIIQNGKLIGAVTHVFTEDPTTGYGIFAETMLEESVVFSMSN